MSSAPMKRPEAAEIHGAVEVLRRRRQRRYNLLKLLAVIAMVIALLTAVAGTVAFPMVLTRDCANPAMDKDAVVLVNLLDKPDQPGDVAAAYEPAYSADTFYGYATRLEETAPAGTLGTVWLQVWPTFSLVK